MEDKPVIAFYINYAGETILCEAVMNDIFYQVYFNGKYVCDISMNDDEQWILEAGTVLPQGTIDEIGRFIESKLS